MRGFPLFALLLSPVLAVTACARSDREFSNKPPSLQVGAAALAGGAPEAALSVARRQLAGNRDDLGALLIEGQALTELGEMGQAEASFRRAIRVSSSSAGARFGLGRVLLITGRAEEAEAAFKATLALQPKDARALTDIGIAEDLQDHHPMAQTMYKQALEMAPDLDAARVNLGLSMALGGDAAGGVQVLRPLAASPAAPPRVRPDLATALALSDRRGHAAEAGPDGGGDAAGDGRLRRAAHTVTGRGVSPGRAYAPGAAILVAQLPSRA